MGSSVKIEGIDPVIRTVLALGPAARKAAKSATIRGAQIVINAVRSSIPRSRKPRTGGWRKGRHVADVLKAESVSRSNFITAGITTPGGVHNGAYFYLRFLEYGRGSTTRKGRHIGAMPRTERITNMLNSKRGQITDTIAAELKREMRM